MRRARAANVSAYLLISSTRRSRTSVEGVVARNPDRSYAAHVGRVVQTVVLAVVLLACHGRAQPEASGIRVVVLGSSTAAGAGLADPQTSWVSRYAAFITGHVPDSSVTNLA